MLRPFHIYQGPQIYVQMVCGNVSGQYLGLSLNFPVN